MFDAKVAKLLNEQINKELYSAYLYVYFANHFTEAGLIGFANWFTVQAMEERDHALLFIRYMQNNEQPVTLDAIAKPEANTKTHLDVLKEGLTHEQFVTASIHTIYDAAYVALAEALQVTLLTGDRRLARATGPQCAIEVITTDR